MYEWIWYAVLAATLVAMLYLIWKEVWIAIVRPTDMDRDGESPLTLPVRVRALQEEDDNGYF